MTAQEFNGHPQRHHDLLSITKLVSVFDTFDSEREAVESYAATTPA